MNKTFTPTPIIASSSVIVAENECSRPSRATLSRIRQFARVYSYSAAAGALGGMVLN